MAKITLARALKYKNRVVERMRKLEGDVQTNNSILAGSERDIDPVVALKERLSLEKHLVYLKLQLDATNAPIKILIAGLQELKGRIGFLTRINTSHGKVDARRTMFGQEGEILYEAVIRKNELDKMVSEAQEEIDTTQEQIDQFNNKTLIEVEMFPLK